MDTIKFERAQFHFLTTFSLPALQNIRSDNLCVREVHSLFRFSASYFSYIFVVKSLKQSKARRKAMAILVNYTGSFYVSVKLPTNPSLNQH